MVRPPPLTLNKIRLAPPRSSQPETLPNCNSATPPFTGISGSLTVITREPGQNSWGQSKTRLFRALALNHFQNFFHMSWHAHLAPDVVDAALRVDQEGGALN